MPDTELIRDRIELLSTQAGELSTSIGCLAEAQRRSRRWIWVLAVLGAVVAATLLVTIVALVRVNNANDRTHRLAEYQATSCAAENEFRATIQQFIASLAAPPPSKLTDAQKKAQDVLQAKAARSFAPRDCTKAGR